MAEEDMQATADQQRLVQLTARALARANLVHAFGHCSLRLDRHHFLVCAARPMGLIETDPGTVVPVEGTLPQGVLGEVRAHQAIYRIRPDIGGICRIMPPALMALSTQSIVPRARHGLGAYFHPGPVLWDDPRLLREEAAAAAVAERLQAHSAIVMRGNGALVVAEGLENALVLSWFLEDAARVERDVRTMGFASDSGLFSAEEVSARQVFEGQVVERMWAWLTRE
jgi:HCOMODA/2-hydroxy-3-carboxy-muconic semialdehyde decarboxylase